jgi:hypothetical protein
MSRWAPTIWSAPRLYDALAAELGVGRMMECESFIAWGDAGGKPGIGLTVPFDGQPASVGNGVMVALAADPRRWTVCTRWRWPMAAATKAPPAHAAKASMPPISAIPMATS